MLSDLKAVVVAPPSRGLLRFWESRSISLYYAFLYFPPSLTCHHFVKMESLP
ncbi:unnamed protein product [Brassica oleracea]